MVERLSEADPRINQDLIPIAPYLQTSVRTLRRRSGVAEIVPRYFVISTLGVEDALPDTSTVAIEFQATTLSSLGSPDEGSILPSAGSWARDISTLNYVGNSELQFVRFRVRFDIGVGTELSATTPRPKLEFLTIPFTF